MRLALTAVAISSLAAAASSQVAAPADPLQAQLARARAEQAAAETEARKLERAATDARSAADRLRTDRAAAAQQIEAAEARITAAEARLRLIGAYLQSRRARLEREQRPVANLLAGLAVMAERPPLLAIAGGGGTDEFVEVRALLDATLPTIRRRTAALSNELRHGARLEQAAAGARAELLSGREDLVARRDRFAALEEKANQAAAAAGGRALSAGDVALTAGEYIERFRTTQAGVRETRALAATLAAGDPAPPRPSAPDTRRPAFPFGYVLPVDATVTDGLGSVNESGIRSRGLSLATARGALVRAPANGVVRFSGAYRDYDGVVIIEHGRGWISLLVNVGSPLRPGSRVRVGDPLGRALGPLVVELSQNGKHYSPALIAGSSRTLSKDRKGG